MSGGDKRALHIADGGNTSQNCAHGFEMTTDTDESNLPSDSLTFDEKQLLVEVQNDKSETTDTVQLPKLVQEPVPPTNSNSSVTKPVRVLIDFFENSKAPGIDAEKKSPAVPKHTTEYRSQIQMRIRVEDSPNELLSWSFEGATPSATPVDPIGCIPSNLFKVETKAELDQLLAMAGSTLLFLFFLPDNCSITEQFGQSFLPKINELANRQPDVIFIAAYVDVESQGWTRWNQVADCFQTCRITGQPFVLFQNSVRIHESEADGSKALGSMVTDLIDKYRGPKQAEAEKPLDISVVTGSGPIVREGQDFKQSEENGCSNR